MSTRLKTTLVASTLVCGLAFAAAMSGGAPFSATPVSLANAQTGQAVTVTPTQATAPASFADVVEAVRPAVVSVRVRQSFASPDRERRRGERNERGDRGGRDGFAPPEFRDLPQDHPFNRFFRRYGEREDRGGRGERRNPRRFGQSQGSGFIISADGYVVTNHHVIARASDITIVMDDGTEHDATLIGADERTDLALLKIEADEPFTYVAFGNTDPEDGALDARVGDWVVTMGNPFGLGGTVTAGIVSARGRDIGAGPYDDFLQIDAPVNRGNSGGPAFSLNGKVIGVNTAIFSPNGGNVGIAFAIPASTAADIIAELRADGQVTRGWLGVSIQPVTPDIAESLGLDDAEGAIVSSLTEDSPAGEAGLRVGDTIVAVNGETVSDPKDLARKIAAIDPGQSADVTVWRNARARDIAVEIGTLPDRVAAATPAQEPVEASPTALDEFGLALAPAPQGEGVVITDIEPDGEAARKGLRRGDLILQAAGEPVSSADDVAAAIARSAEAGRDALLVLLQRGETNRFVALNVG